MSIFQADNLAYFQIVDLSGFKNLTGLFIFDLGLYS